MHSTTLQEHTAARPWFMGNANRLNVSLSRARIAMFIVGGWRQLLGPKNDATWVQQVEMLENVIKYIFAEIRMYLYLNRSIQIWT